MILLSSRSLDGGESVCVCARKRIGIEIFELSETREEIARNAGQVVQRQPSVPIETTKQARVEGTQKKAAIADKHGLDVGCVLEGLGGDVEYAVCVQAAVWDKSCGHVGSSIFVWMTGEEGNAKRKTTNTNSSCSSPSNVFLSISLNVLPPRSLRSHDMAFKSVR